MKKLKKVMSLLLIAVLTLSMTLVTGCKKNTTEASKDKLDKLVVTVDDTKIKLKDMMYFIYDTEALGESYSQSYGMDYWEVKGSDGQTNREKAKDYVIDNAVMIQIMSQKAKEAKLKLTDDETKQNKENVKSLLGQVTADQLKLTGFTEDSLLATFNKIILASKYYDKLVKGFDIDEDSIKASIKKADYKQYDTSFIFFPIVSLDANGQSVELSAKEKKKALDNANEALTQVKAGKSFDDLKEKYKDGMVSTLNVVENDQSDAEYKAATKKLKVNEVSNVVTTSSGYYIIKLTDNTKTDSYDNAVTQAVSQAQNEKFTTEYDKIKKDYKVEVNKKVWDTITIGKTTIVQADTSKTNTDTNAATDNGSTDDTSKDSTKTDSSKTDDTKNTKTDDTSKDGSNE